MSTRARNIPPARTGPTNTPRPRGAGFGNGLTRAVWLHLLHLGGRAQRPLAVHQAIEPAVPDTTRAHTNKMLTRMAAAGQVQRHTTPGAGRPQYAYSVSPGCIVPYGLSLEHILTAAHHALPPPVATGQANTPAAAPTAAAPAPAPTPAQLAAALGEDTIRRIREEFNQPHTER